MADLAEIIDRLPIDEARRRFDFSVRKLQEADAHRNVLIAAEQLAEAARQALADRNHFAAPNPSGITDLERNHPVLTGRLKNLERATDAYAVAVQTEREFKEQS